MKCKFFLGVGKSYLIQMIAMFAEHYLREPGQNPSCVRVLICAPTGKAASVIGK